ncbi:hypothetical protein Sste5346_007826 [Sporothrix stenoceras]|uniref:Dynamin family protein n=1 Tax=Sporothrix stenoceras TaxID=5173 RepID=A0ABR3YTM0_9PEZI
MAARQQLSATEPLDVLAELNNEESSTLLDTIDSLRELQVGDIVSLPQIVVVGDQSTGKSSVLEAISRVRFPVDAKLCTRFATELVLRRAEKTKVAVWIRYADSGKKRDSSDAEPFRRTEFDNIDSLPDIIDEAKAHMGISGGGGAHLHKDGQSPKRFTKDVLRVEISRPDVYPLTLVDLPGIFHNETADQTVDDKNLVNRLINSYLQQEKSIILAVVTATNQLANQEVVNRAKKNDPQRKRTMGVITKADLSHEGGVTQQFVDVVKGLDPTHKFRLGWFVLRNLSEKQKLEGVTFDERDALEKTFFQTAPGWSSVRETNRGVHSLRKALSRVLLGHIKIRLPGLVQDIENELNLRRDKLRRLGRPKTDPDELRLYMLDVAKEFYRLAGDGINGRYADDFFDGADEGPLKFRANLRKLNSAFCAVLKEKGAAQKILQATDPVPFDGPLPSNGHNNAASQRNKSNVAPYYLVHLILEYQNFPSPKITTRATFDRDFEVFAANNRGRELCGVPSSDLAIDLFRRQSKPWGGIARFHLDLVLKFSKSFVETVFTHVIGDNNKRTLAAVLNTYSDPFFENKRAVLEAKLDEILRPYTKGNGIPLETEFCDSLYEMAHLRLEQRMTPVLETGDEILTKDKGGLTRDNFLFTSNKVARLLDNSEFGTEQVVDMMIVYYEMSRRTFTENVINLVVENCLVCDLPEVLTAGTIFRMSDDRLRELASESDDVAAKRTRLQEEVRILEQGLARCRMYKPRTTTGQTGSAGGGGLFSNSTATTKGQTGSTGGGGLFSNSTATTKGQTSSTSGGSLFSNSTATTKGQTGSTGGGSLFSNSTATTKGQTSSTSGGGLFGNST